MYVLYTVVVDAVERGKVVARINYRAETVYGNVYRSREPIIRFAGTIYTYVRTYAYEIYRQTHPFCRQRPDVLFVSHPFGVVVVVVVLW